MNYPKSFVVYRKADISETHNENQVNPADEVQFEGVVFTDGTCAIRWRTAKRSTSVWNSFEDMMAIHGHPEYDTEVKWYCVPPEFKELPIAQNLKDGDIEILQDIAIKEKTLDEVTLIKGWSWRHIQLWPATLDRYHKLGLLDMITTLPSYKGYRLSVFAESLINKPNPPSIYNAKDVDM